MPRRLVFVHGRAQEYKDAAALKAEWLDALSVGLANAGLALPIAEDDVRFPFYGDTLFQLTEGAGAHAAEVILRGAQDDAGEREFVASVLQEIARQAGIGPEQLADVTDHEVIERGAQDWRWLRGTLRAIDRHVPYGSGASIALITRDVYAYLTDVAIRETIQAGLAEAIEPGVETVVVGHSLGSVVAYDLLRREGHLRGWRVPLFVTVGAPLAVEAIRKAVKRLATTRCPECASAWLNALDPGDVVALYPLDPDNFPLDPSRPAIENRADVRNRTRNRHGIAGYLDDAEVARRIHGALAG